jgi:hypothetical protein
MRNAYIIIKIEKKKKKIIEKIFNYFFPFSFNTLYSSSHFFSTINDNSNNPIILLTHSPFPNRYHLFFEFLSTKFM